VTALFIWVYFFSGVFRVDEVRVEGNISLEREYIVRKAGVGPRTHLLFFDEGDAERALRGEPRVERADVRREFPDGLVIRVKEREPVAVLKQGDVFLLVDRGGWVIREESEKPVGLPELTGLSFPDLDPGDRLSGGSAAAAMALINSMSPRMRPLCSEVGGLPGGDLYAVVDGIKVIYGEATLLEKKNAVTALSLQQLRSRYPTMEYLDVSLPDRPVMKPA
jgi:cell division protein FtsQ